MRVRTFWFVFLSLDTLDSKRSSPSSSHRSSWILRRQTKISRFFFVRCRLFSSPNFSLGIWDLLSARSSIGTSEALGWLAVSGTPCPHGLRPMRCKICCGCEHRPLRGQCKECGGSSSFCEHRQQRYYCNCKECGGSQQLLRAQAAAQPVQGVWPQQLLRARAPARLLQL